PILKAEGKEETFKARRVDGRTQFYRDGRPMPSRPAKIIVSDDGQRVAFLPDRDPAGHYKVAKSRTPVGEVEGSLNYRDDRGRVMIEGSLGAVSIARPGWLAANLALNFLHLVVWFLCLWLLL